MVVPDRPAQGHGTLCPYAEASPFSRSRINPFRSRFEEAQEVERPAYPFRAEGLEGEGRQGARRHGRAEEREDRRYQRRSVRSGAAADGMVTTTVTLPVLQSRQFISAINFVAGTPGQGDTRTTEQRLADGLVMLCDALAKGEVKGGRERPTVLLVFDIEAYLGDTNTPARTANGDRLPACVARHLAENAHLQRVVEAGSRILDLGTVVRLASDDQYRALLVRDGGCRWLGCEIPAAWCEVDHLVPYPAGPTNLDDLVNC